ncbi:MarR family winged helix-turn-helix transcriptional regulator [Pseudonocardia sp. H11422]|uniref:MarR family winged helix-turn-helix transcriptional regulator n=1 Tax=Pseudonocardia sp. H11422 TaxID=2835866 RepID=UPI001BDD22B1|nr:MarR family transcriptional regulator [Pseudonocardia sp. H11422]
MASDPVIAFDKVFELAARIDELMQATLTERGLTPARAEVLLALHHQGRPMVQRELGRALRCTARHVTALVDALEADGWVSRGRHPTDRRATLVSLTEQGTAAADRMATERRDAAHALLGDLPTADLTGFVAVADHVLRHLDSAPTPVR